MNSSVLSLGGLCAGAALFIFALAACGDDDPGSRFPACTDACVEGEAQCLSTTQFQTCVMASNGCRVFSGAMECAAEQECTAGSCAPAGGSSSGSGSSSGGGCDTCNVGTATCDGNGRRICTIDAEGCANPGDLQVCDPGTECQNGMCVAVSECCTIGMTRCEGNTAWSCEDPDGDDCGRWDEESCGDNRLCMDGTCEATGTCSENTDCDETDMCVRGRCREIYGSRYRVRPTSAVITEAPSSDPFGFGDIDPYVEIIINEDEDDEQTFATETVDDSFSPAWTDAFEIIFTADQTIKVQLWDDDSLLLLGDDLLAETVFSNGFPAEHLREGGWTWTATGEDTNLTVSFIFERIDN